MSESIEIAPSNGNAGLKNSKNILSISKLNEFDPAFKLEKEILNSSKSIFSK